MADLVNTCQEKNLATFIPVKMLLDRHLTFIQTCFSWHILVEIVVGFTTSLGLKPTDNRSPSYGRFTESMSRGNMATFVPAKTLLEKHESVIKA